MSQDNLENSDLVNLKITVERLIERASYITERLNNLEEEQDETHDVFWRLIMFFGGIVIALAIAVGILFVKVL